MNDILLFVARFLAIWFVAGPIVTLLHELGHAVAALVLTRGDVKVWVGTGRMAPCVSLGRLHLSMTYRPGFTGFYRYAGGTFRGARATIILAGPITSLAMVLLAFGIGALTDAGDNWLGESVVVIFGYAALVQLLATAVPWRYPRSWGEYAGMDSDGLHLIRVMRAHEGRPAGSA